MTENLVKFKNIDWTSPALGVSEKVFKSKGKILRLVKFDDNFNEKDWCTKSHFGFVLSGEMTIDFNGILNRYQSGDGLWIENGRLTPHQVIIHKGKQVELILFEED